MEILYRAYIIICCLRQTLNLHEVTPAGHRCFSTAKQQAELRRDALVLTTVTRLLVTPETAFRESYGAVQLYRQQQPSDERRMSAGSDLYHTDIKHWAVKYRADVREAAL